MRFTTKHWFGLAFILLFSLEAYSESNSLKDLWGQSLRKNQKTYNQIRVRYEKAILKKQNREPAKRFDQLRSVKDLAIKIEIQKRIYNKLDRTQPHNTQTYPRLREWVNTLLQQERESKNKTPGVEQGLLSLRLLLETPALNQTQFLKIIKNSLSFSAQVFLEQLKPYDYSHPEAGTNVKPKNTKDNIGLFIEPYIPSVYKNKKRELANLPAEKKLPLNKLLPPYRHESSDRLKSK